MVVLPDLEETQLKPWLFDPEQLPQTSRLGRHGISLPTIEINIDRMGPLSMIIHVGATLFGAQPINFQIYSSVWFITVHPGQFWA